MTAADRKAYAAAWYKRNAARLAARRRERRKADPVKADQERHKDRLRSYGLSPEEYADRLKRQRNVCAICRKPPRGDGRFKRLAIDHDHKTGKFRGLLCHQCNIGLGGFADSRKNLLRAVAYLEKA